MFYFPTSTYSSTHCNLIATWLVAPIVCWNCSGQIPDDLRIAKPNVLFFISIFPNTSVAHDTVDTFLLLKIPHVASDELYAYSLPFYFLPASHWCSWTCRRAILLLFTTSHTPYVLIIPKSLSPASDLKKKNSVSFCTFPPGYWFAHNSERSSLGWTQLGSSADLTRLHSRSCSHLLPHLMLSGLKWPHAHNEWCWLLAGALQYSSV